LTTRGRCVFFGVALLVQSTLIAIDYQVHDILLAAAETIPILALAACVNYRTAFAFAIASAIVAGALETQPEPQPLTNPDVWVNAAIISCGYFIALGLLCAIRNLTKRLRGFVEDFSELKEAHDDLLPEQLPWLGDWEFSVLNVPQREIGGLFYDVAAWRGGIDLFASAVSGPPIRAAMVLPALKGLWLGTGALPPASLRTLNKRLRPLLRGETSARAWYGKLYNNGIVRYASAGFPAPFLVSGDGSVRRLAGGGTSLGAYSGADVAEAMYMLDGGAALVVGNEGFCNLVEAGAVEPGDLLRRFDELQARLRTLSKDCDVLAIVARRKTNFLFSHHFEEPVLAGDDDPDRLLQPRNPPKLEP
jgi:hypothetical protein